MGKGQLRGVPLDQLNDNEERVLFALESNGPSKIGDIAAVAWEDFAGMERHPRGEAQAHSWVRNALRRLVASGWAVKLGPGLYGTHESLEARLGGLAVADAEDAHREADVALERAYDRLGRAHAEYEAARREIGERRTRVRAAWKTVLAARKAVR